MEPALFYIEFDSGYCTILEAADAAEAREEGVRFAKAYRTRVTKVRPASDDDRASFHRMGGTVYR